MKLKHRFLSIILALSLTISCVAVSASASGFNPVVDTISSANDSRISAMVDAMKYQSFSSPSLSKVQSYIRYFIYDSKYAAVGGAAWPYTNENGYVSTVTDGTYTISGINGSGCFAYAKWVMNVIYGTTGSALSEGEGAGGMTASGIESFLRTNAQAGEQLRLGNVHSVTFISCSANGFYYMDYWGGYIRLHYTTFSKWASACNNYGGGNEMKLYNANTNKNDASAQKAASTDTAAEINVDRLTITPGSYPSGQLKMGSSFSLTGSVDTQSGHAITQFIGSIYKSDNTLVTYVEIKPNTQSVNIQTSDVNKGLSFGSLPEGDYYLEYAAEDSDGTIVVWTSDSFTVVDTVSNLAISPSAYPTGKLLASSFNLTGTVTSNYDIKTVSGYIYDTDGNIIYSSLIRDVNATSFQIEDSNIDNALKFGALTPGQYYLQYEAADASGYSVVWKSAVFTIVSSLDDPDPSPTPDSTAKVTVTPEPSGNLTKGRAFSFGGSVSSDYNLTSVTCTVCRADGTASSQSYTYDLDYTTKSMSLSTFNGMISFGKLDSGYYYMQFTVKDASGATGIWKSQVFAISGTVLFTDVPSESWYSSAVYSLASRGFVSGMGNNQYMPSNQLTRAQVVVMLYAAAGKPSVSGSMPFTDCTADWYKNAVIWAKNVGIVSGTSATTFNPNSYITRQEMAVILRAFCVKVCGADSNAADLISSYADTASISSWAVDAANWCVANGLISSISTEEKLISPTTTSTRAQCAVQINNIVQKYGL